MHLWDQGFKVLATVQLAYLWCLEICIFYAGLQLCSVSHKNKKQISNNKIHSVITSRLIAFKLHLKYYLVNKRFELNCEERYSDLEWRFVFITIVNHSYCLQARIRIPPQNWKCEPHYLQIEIISFFSWIACAYITVSTITFLLRVLQHFPSDRPTSRRALVC